MQLSLLFRNQWFVAGWIGMAIAAGLTSQGEAQGRGRSSADKHKHSGPQFASPAENDKHGHRSKAAKPGHAHAGSNDWGARSGALALGLAIAGLDGGNGWEGARSGSLSPYQNGASYPGYQYGYGFGQPLLVGPWMNSAINEWEMSQLSPGVVLPSQSLYARGSDPWDGRTDPRFSGFAGEGPPSYDAGSQSSYYRPYGLATTGQAWTDDSRTLPGARPAFRFQHHDPAADPAGPYFAQALEAFAHQDYPVASKLANHALIEAPSDGRLKLFAAQCQLATGDFAGAAQLTAVALRELPVEAWGGVVANFRDYYRHNDYVGHLARLEAVIAQPGAAAGLSALLGYHYFYLGHVDAAQSQLQRGLQMDPGEPLAGLILPLCQTGSAAPPAFDPPAAPKPANLPPASPPPSSSGTLPAPAELEEIPIG